MRLFAGYKMSEKELGGKAYTRASYVCQPGYLAGDKDGSKPNCLVSNCAALWLPADRRACWAPRGLSRAAVLAQAPTQPCLW